MEKKEHLDLLDVLCKLLTEFDKDFKPLDVRGPYRSHLRALEAFGGGDGDQYFRLQVSRVLVNQLPVAYEKACEAFQEAAQTVFEAFQAENNEFFKTVQAAEEEGPRYTLPDYFLKEHKLRFPRTVSLTTAHASTILGGLKNGHITVAQV
jgi:hypothetical protein